MSTDLVQQPTSLEPDRRYEDDIELREYLLALWHRRILVVSMTLLAAALGVATVWVTEPRYQASVTLARTSSLSKLGDEATAESELSIRALLQNRRIADAVIKEFALDREPYGFTATSFVDDAVRVENLDGVGLFSAKVTIVRSPAVAANVANSLAQRAVELNRQMNQAESVAARDFIKIQLDEARGALDRIERTLVERQQQMQIGAVEADVDAMLAGRRELLALSAEIEGEKARLAKSEQELAQRDRISPAPRLVDASSALLEGSTQPPSRRPRPDSNVAAAPTRDPQSTARLPAASNPDPGDPRPRAPAPDWRSPASSPDLQGLNLRSEFVNPVYEALDYQVATSRTRLASLQEQERRLREGMHIGAANPVLATLYVRQSELARLKTEYDLAKQTYADLSRKYDQARIQVASRTSQLEIIDPAVPPERPIAPRPLRTVLIATMIGLLLAVLTTFFLAYVGPTALAPSAADDRRAKAYV